MSTRKQLLDSVFEGIHHGLMQGKGCPQAISVIAVTTCYPLKKLTIKGTFNSKVW